MTQQDAIRFARFYLYNESCFNPTTGDHLRHDQGGKNVILTGGLTDYQLHKDLQFYLCRAYKRLEACFGEGEVNQKDIAHIVEAWILAVRNDWECIGWDTIGWRKVKGIVYKNDNVQPTARMTSETCPQISPIAK